MPRGPKATRGPQCGLEVAPDWFPQVVLPAPSPWHFLEILSAYICASLYREAKVTWLILQFHIHTFWPSKSHTSEHRLCWGSSGNHHISGLLTLLQLVSSMISQGHPSQQGALRAFSTAPLLSPGMVLKSCLQKAFPGGLQPQWDQPSMFTSGVGKSRPGVRGAYSVETSGVK